MDKDLTLKIKSIKLVTVSGCNDKIYILTDLPTTQPNIADIAGYETLVLEIRAQEGYGEQWIRENLKVETKIIENGIEKRRRKSHKKGAK